MEFKNVFAVVLTGVLSLCFITPQADAAGAVDIKVEKSRTKNFGDSTTIIVPTVYVKLTVAGKVTATKQGSALSTIGGGSANTVKASAHYSVDGLDKKMAQQIAGKVYDDFVGRLRAAGYTVKTYADIKDMEPVKKVTRLAKDKAWDMPMEKDPLGTAVYVVATPSDDQAFKPGLGGAVFGPFMRLGKSTLGEGTVVIPTYTLVAPQAWAETGGGVGTISANANVAAGMTMMSAIAPLLTSGGAWGDVKTKSWNRVADKVGDLTQKDTTDNVGNAFNSSLSLLTGSGKTSGKSGYYQLAVDPAAYEAAVLSGTGAFNEVVAKIIVEERK